MWLIDHGATLSFHHRWESAPAYDARPYDADDHVLIALGPDVTAADHELAPLLTRELIESAIADVPEAWIDAEPGIGDAAAVRSAYAERVLARLEARRDWLPGLVSSSERGGRR
jgi:hypothetical protein